MEIKTQPYPDYNKVKTQTIIDFCKKIYNGCERTQYVKQRASDLLFIAKMTDRQKLEIETESNCFSIVEDILGSVVFGEV